MSRRAVLRSFNALLLFIVIQPAIGRSAPARASAETDAIHCLLRTQSSPESLQLEIVERSCFPTFEQVLTAASAPPTAVYDSLASPLTAPSSVGISTGIRPLITVLTDFTLAVHYDGSSFGGASLTVTGGNCAGGYINLPADWNNRISSTTLGCSVVKHYDSINITGTVETLTSSGNLTYMDNRSTSVQYTT